MNKHLIEAAKLALDALYMVNTRQWPENKIGAAINALSAAIAEAEKPVTCNGMPAYEGPLSAAQRQWVGLTDEEAMQTWEGIIKYAPGEVRLKDFARAIEAKLKEKNT